ncbi:flavodoxin family protein [Deferrisoma camini]|uniref:flavodoxin family protein n=1 Tax=Deferrisoma camini TaxID=1035120 RepID=UPI00046D7498|nr:flavodoxin family protein [Deferrisoma camini]
MRVVCIGGSLRPQSNTLEYLNRCAGILEQEGIETEVISLRGKEIQPCRGCYECVETARCAIQDDDFAEILDKMCAADGIVLGSPVYMSSVVPPMMALLSRATFVAHWNGKFLAGKVGGPITVARRAGHNLAFSQLLLWFFINGITVPGSTYWTVGMAGTGGARDALEDQEGMGHVENFARNLADVLRKIRA